MNIETCIDFFGSEKEKRKDLLMKVHGEVLECELLLAYRKIVVFETG